MFKDTWISANIYLYHSTKTFLTLGLTEALG